MSCIAIFENVRKVIKAEQICSKNGIMTEVIPIPENISSECGMTLRLDDAHIDAFEKIMKDAGIFYKINKI